MKIETPWPQARVMALVLGFAVATTLLTELIFSDIRQAIIAGLLVAILGALFEVRLEIHESARTSQSLSTREIDRLISHLNLDRLYSKDDWLLQVLNDIVALKNEAQHRLHDLKRIQTYLGDAIKSSRKESGHPYRPFVKDELDRALYLRDAVDTATDTDAVRALTFDYDDYLNRFWSQLFGETYIKSNLDAASRGIAIKRIFVVSGAVLDGRDTEKHEKLRGLFRQLKRGKRITLLVAEIEKLPDEIKASTTSFLTSGRYFASESHGLRDGVAAERYVCYGDEELVVTLNRRFEQLELLARSWKFA